MGGNNNGPASERKNEKWQKKFVWYFIGELLNVATFGECARLQRVLFKPKDTCNNDIGLIL